MSHRVLSLLESKKLIARDLQNSSKLHNTLTQEEHPTKLFSKSQSQPGV